MNLLDKTRLRLARFLYKAATGSSLTFVPEWVRYSVFTPTFRALIAEGYKANSAVFACVEALAFSFPEPALMSWKEGKNGPERNPTHPVRKLLKRPNPDMGEAEFHQVAITYCAIGGNVYIWKQRNALGLVIALWPFHDGQIVPIAGRSTAEGLVKEYELDIGDGRKVIIPKGDIIHWKWMPDPQYPWRGIGAIVAAARDVDTDNEVASYVFSLLKNDAVPRMIVTLVEGEEFDEDRVKRMQAQWMQKYGGDNRGAPAFLEAGMKAEKVSFDLVQMAFEALRAVPESRISAGFRVPPIIAGLLVGLNRSTFSNYGEARKAFTEDTLIPLWRGFSSEMEADLAEEFGDDELILRHDIGQVRALQENTTEIWTRANIAYNSGWATRAEARQQVGLSVGPADQVYKESITTFLTPADQLPAPRPAPEPAPDEGMKQLSAVTFKSLKQAGHTGVMVALMLPPHIADGLEAAMGVLPEGAQPVPAGDLHLTLAYLGDMNNLVISPGAVVDVVQRFAAEWGPMSGIINGTGRMMSGQGDMDVWYASFDSPRLPAFRQALVDRLTEAGIAISRLHGFIPHVTLAYLPPAAPTPQIDLALPSFVFQNITLVWGDGRAGFYLQGVKQLGASQRKDARRERRKELVEARRRVRGSVSGRAEAAIQGWFNGLADRVTGRVRKGWPATGETKRDQLTADDLLPRGEMAGLEQVVARYSVEIMASSWGLIDLELGEVSQFDTNDPLVAQVLERAGLHIRDIEGTTRDALRVMLQNAYDEGWSIDEIAPSVRDLITETYANRAKTIARTEVGAAQNTATVGRYARAGVQHVEVFDDGFDNSHEFCKLVNGKVVNLAWAERNPLQHPNCVRAFGAVFDYQGDVFTDERPWGS